jgi:hypothetical protein
MAEAIALCWRPRLTGLLELEAVQAVPHAGGGHGAVTYFTLPLLRSEEAELVGAAAPAACGGGRG